MIKLDPAGYAARGPAHVKAKRQQKQLAGQTNPISSSTQPSEEHSNSNTNLNSSARSLPLDLPSGSVPGLQLRPIPTTSSAHSADIDMDQDSDYSDVAPHSNSFHTEIPQQPNVPHTIPAPESYTRPFPDTLPLAPSQAVTSPSMTTALAILRDIAPQMTVLTRILDSHNVDEQDLDAQDRSLVIGGMEAAALLERQLARLASQVQCYRP